MYDYSYRSNDIYINNIDSLIGKIDLIDIRDAYDYQMSTIRTARNIPMNELLSNPSYYLREDKIYYIMCQSGKRSSRICSELRGLGFNVINVIGGFSSYTGANRI
ncbi:rhodanese-like domain-containing protein [Clostridium ihumii]|uniref:rhodanese-like domain-containing protein n=1 Tax=Clostridium ihumii TaxID=1470356 RepID=UPI00058DCC6B|nr:rhodanese-like domain-containing protein [Clostridium ihumii]